MKKLPKFTAIRKQNFARYVANLQGTNYILPRPDYDDMDWLAFPLQHKKRGEVLRYLEERNVQVLLRFSNFIFEPGSSILKHSGSCSTFELENKIRGSGVFRREHHKASGV